MPLPHAGGQVSAFSNSGGSAFSPIAPLQGGGGISATSALSMGRQPSDTWNVRVHQLFTDHGTASLLETMQQQT